MCTQNLHSFVIQWLQFWAEKVSIAISTFLLLWKPLIIETVIYSAEKDNHRTKPSGLGKVAITMHLNPSAKYFSPASSFHVTNVQCSTMHTYTSQLKYFWYPKRLRCFWLVSCGLPFMSWCNMIWYISTSKTVQGLEITVEKPWTQ